jgi:hypothetical protein
MGKGGMAGTANGGMGGITVPDCTGQTPEDGESCDDSGLVCQSDGDFCACFDQGDGPQWICLGGLGGMGAGGRGFGGFNFGGFGNFGQAGAGGRG